MNVPSPKAIAVWQRLTLLWGLLLAGTGQGTRAAGEEASQAVTGGWFSGSNIVHIQIEVPQKSFDKLRGRGWDWGGGRPTRQRPEVGVTVREGGAVYTNVAMHLKGSAGSFQPIDSKPALTLNFDKLVKGQRFHGLQKVSLNNSVQDPSFLCEKTSRELFNEAGVPAPRADFATVELNGRRLGFYVLIEGYNRQFLKRHFHNSKGRLYDGGFLRDIDSPLALNAGEDTEDTTDLRPLLAAANETEVADRFAELAKVLDMDRFVTFLAMEVLLCHWDGYGMNKNNYRIYHDPDTDRVVFMPHGMDQMFGVMMVDPGLGVRPPLQGLVAKALLDTTEGRRRYFQRLAELNQSLFDVEKITNRVMQSALRIQSALAGFSPAAAANHQTEVEQLCDRIALRKQSLEEQLSGARGRILEFDAEGVAHLTGWTPLTNAGSPILTHDTAQAGPTALSIRATQGLGVASWRSRALLEEGHYSFQGRLRAKGILVDARDQRAGAGLRISGKPAPAKVRSDSAWQEVAFEFDVPDGLHDVELVCELRAAAGEVWFDAASLRLIRK